MASKRPKSITIRHVAAAAGVSLQTVSRVINNGPNVSDHVNLRVKDAIAKLGYVPSIAARRLGGSRSYLILALNDRERTLETWRLGEGGEWVNQMLLGGITKCEEHGYRMIVELVETHDDHVDRALMGVLSSLRPDGVILTPPHSDNAAIMDLLTRQGIAFARIGATTDTPGFAIRMDDANVAGVATQHLLDLGHRRIGFIKGSEDYANSALRAEGYRATMRAAGLAHDDLMEPGDFTFAAGVAAAQKLSALADPITAVIASNEQMALGALEVVKGLGLSVPGDISLISFEDAPIVRFTSPPLTAIAHPIAEATALAAEVLIAANGKGPEPASTHLLAYKFIPRASTGPRLA